MNAPEPTDPMERELAELLLEYDAALAAGGASARSRSPELPEEFRESLFCLELLERARLSNGISERLDRLTLKASLTPSLPNAPTAHPGIPTSEKAANLAHLGRFQILKVIGEGGCGVVFLAHDPDLRRQVAIKIPRPEGLLRPDLRRRFVREGRAAAGLDHPHLVSVFEAGEIGAICYLASAYCPGITLREWLRQNGRPAEPRAAAKLIATLAEAMDYAHQRGVCHRDLKPSNVLLMDEESGIRRQEAGDRSQEPGVRWHGSGSRRPDSCILPPVSCPLTPDSCLLQSAIPKIIDFGMAKVIRDDCDDALTRTGAVIGTPQYMAPEQAQGKTQAIGPATDIHGLGVILYELLTGQMPYHGDTDLEILNQVIAAEPGSPRQLCPQVPRDLETICLKCLQKQPENRYGSMRDLGEDLQRFLEGRPIQARRIGWASRAVKGVKRRPRAAAVGALISVLLFSLLGVLLWIGNRESVYNADLNKAQQALEQHKNREEEQDWLARNQEYVAQIRTAALLKNEGELAKVRDVLLAQKPAPDQQDVRGFEWQYLWRSGQDLCRSGPTFIAPEQKSEVTAIAYAESGDLCVSGSLDGTIFLFDRRTGKLITNLQGHGFEVRTLHFLKGDTQLLSTAFTVEGEGFRSEFILWSLGRENKILRRGDYSYTGKKFGHPNFALATAAHSLFIIVHNGAQDQLLMLDLETGAERLLLKGESLYSVATTPQADALAIVRGTDHSDGQWSVDSLEILGPSMRQVAVHRFDKVVHMAEFSPDGKTLALGVGWHETERRVEIREAPSLRLLNSFEFAQLPSALRFDWRGKRLAVMTGQTHFHFFDTQTGRSLGSFRHEAAKAMALAFSPDGEELAVGTWDGRLQTGRNVLDGQNSLPGPLPKSETWCVAFSPNGSSLAAGYDHEDGSEHDTLRLWDLSTKKWRSLPGHEATVMALGVSPDGKTLATASYDQSVRLWDMATGKCLHELNGHLGTVRALAFSPDGMRVASAGSDLLIRTWNVNDGSPEKSWKGHDDMVRSLAFSSDGNLLISGANDRTTKVWNAGDGSLVREIADEAQIQSVACSPDGSLFATGNTNNKVELWHISTGTLWKSLLGHTGKIRTVAFSPDGKTLASGGEDKTVRLWNVVTGQELLVLPTEHFVDGLAFHPHKPILAAALHNGTVKLWSGE
jgi:eukaryotic-like serine/threonine-protein kinase